MIVYVVTYFNEHDYNCSWTGNYSGASCKLYGVFTNKEKAMKVADSIGGEYFAIELDKTNEEIYKDNTIYYPIETLGEYIDYHEDDY